MARSTASLALVLSGAAIAALFQPSCLDPRDSELESPDDGRCASCHGDPERAGDFLQRSAPPNDLLGAGDTPYPGVGAHAIHLYASDTHGAIACSECHIVPEHVDDPGHADDSRPAEIVFGELARRGDRNPSYKVAQRRCDDSYCHGDARAVWTEVRSSAEACGSCHGLPPPPPHPQISDCSRCHGQVVASDDVTFVAPERHVDGVLDVEFDPGCTACHGSDNPAPPVDLAGATSTSSPGVGAHQVHLAGTPRSRPVPCGECHVVPDDVFDPGHIDGSGPAEVIFSGAATAFGATPLYADGTCSNTACHGAVFPEGHASGGSNTSPVWTVVDGSQTICGSCHGLPPPAPHPKVEFNPICSACHENISPDNATFVRPDLHVDGVVTFELP